MAVHITDVFAFPASEDRADWYGVTGVPDVWIDGVYREPGGGDGCERCYERYRQAYDLRMSETGGLSPVRIEGSFRINGPNAEIAATYTLVDPVPQGEVRATLFLYEDDIEYCCGSGGVSAWDRIVRYIDNQTVTLQNEGDQQVVTRSFEVPPDWNQNNLHAVAILQRTTAPREIIQCARLDAPDFELAFLRRVGSAPFGYGEPTFDGVVTNVSGAPDELTFSVDDGTGWPTDFRVPDDSTWVTRRNLQVAPGESVAVTVRVRTDGAKRIGIGKFIAESANSGRWRYAALRVFNGSPAVLLVDDDGGTSQQGVPYQAPFIHALDSLEVLYEHWDVRNGHGNISPQLDDLAGFDAVLWETAYEVSYPLTSLDIRFLRAYLDLGGGLYLNSMEFLTTQAGPSTFTRDYLGLASWSNNSRCHTASGVEGDPITDGMVLPLTFSTEYTNRVDTTNPAADAAAIFFSEQDPPRPNAIRHEARGFRTVFSTILQNAISESAPAPNNNRTLIQRILAWLTGSGVSATPAPSVPVAGPALRIAPNPLRAPADLRVSLPPGADGGRLLLVDASGRRVRTLLESTRAGERIVRWDGRDDSGRPVAPGVYLARLRHPGGEATQKLVVLP